MILLFFFGALTKNPGLGVALFAGVLGLSTGKSWKLRRSVFPGFA